MIWETRPPIGIVLIRWGRSGSVICCVRFCGRIMYGRGRDMNRGLNWMGNRNMGNGDRRGRRRNGIVLIVLGEKRKGIAIAHIC